MGRFASTVPLYEELRPPYPAEFFRDVAKKLGFGKQHRLIDLGTGPGLLALGFAPYVGRIVGVDPEPAMLAAREAAGRASQAFTLIEGKAEDLPDDVGSFDVVTIGRALHWMDSDAISAPRAHVFIVLAARARRQGGRDAARCSSPSPSAGPRRLDHRGRGVDGAGRASLAQFINLNR